jgi:hypothetical protein
MSKIDKKQNLERYEPLTKGSSLLALKEFRKKLEPLRLESLTRPATSVDPKWWVSKTFGLLLWVEAAWRPGSSATHSNRYAQQQEAVLINCTGPCASCFERRKKKKKEEHFCIGHACHGLA